MNIMASQSSKLDRFFHSKLSTIQLTEECVSFTLHIQNATSIFTYMTNIKQR